MDVSPDIVCENIKQNKSAVNLMGNLLFGWFRTWINFSKGYISSQPNLYTTIKIK